MGVEGVGGTAGVGADFFFGAAEFCVGEGVFCCAGGRVRRVPWVRPTAPNSASIPRSASSRDPEETGEEDFAVRRLTWMILDRMQKARLERALRRGIEAG